MIIRVLCTEIVVHMHLMKPWMSLKKAKRNLKPNLSQCVDGCSRDTSPCNYMQWEQIFAKMAPAWQANASHHPVSCVGACNSTSSEGQTTRIRPYLEPQIIGICHIEWMRHTEGC